MHLDELVFQLNQLSEKALIIKKLDRDQYKHCSDLEIINIVLEQEISKLAKED